MQPLIGTQNLSPRRTAATVTISVISPRTASVMKELGQRYKFKPTEDSVLVREVAAANAHIAHLGQTRERFEVSGAKANPTMKLACEVTYKAVKYRYKHLQAKLDRNARIQADISGCGGEVGDMIEPFYIIQEERKDLDRAEKDKTQRALKREARSCYPGALIES